MVLTGCVEPVTDDAIFKGYHMRTTLTLKSPAEPTVPIAENDGRHDVGHHDAKPQLDNRTVEPAAVVEKVRMVHKPADPEVVAWNQAKAAEWDAAPDAVEQQLR